VRAPTWLLLFLLLFAAACAGVLGFRPSAARPFEHRAHVLDGIHCTKCHEGMAAAGESGPLHLPETMSCMTSECHSKPHDERPCGTCHGRAFAREGAAFARTSLRFEHRTHVARLEGDCVRCHLGIESGAAILRPRMASCSGCHAQQMAARDCDACHEDLRHEGTLPEDHLVHEGDFAKSHGMLAASERELCASCHTESFCTSCHGASAMPLPPERLAFDDPTKLGVHRAGFLSRHADESRGSPGLCTTCHAPDMCQSCHASEGVGGKSGLQSPHPRGWLGLPGQSNEHGRAAWRDPAGCASCHGGEGEKLCVDCHRVGAPGGNPHAPGFASTKRPELDQPCRACHGAGR
jgi:hypothetical protein